MVRSVGFVTAGLVLLLGSSLPAAAARVSFDDLVANLKSPNAKTRQEAASALGKSRRREAVAHLATLVRDPEVKVRLEVVRALGEIRDLSAVPAVVTSLGDGDVDVRGEAIGTLVEIYAERDRSTPVGRFLEIFSDDGTFTDQDFEDSLWKQDPVDVVKRGRAGFLKAWEARKVPVS